MMDCWPPLQCTIFLTLAYFTFYAVR
jgi:hypothetical protein